MPRPAARWLTLLCSLTLAQAAPSAPSPQGPLLSGLRAYLGTFQAVPGETSLLAHAAREGLDWQAFQNLFALQTTDPAAGYLDWRGHSPVTDGSVFTTLRAATYRAREQTLLVVNREWCSGGSCQTRTAFSWLEGGGLRGVRDSAVIPLLRDADFFPGSVPPCLKGVTLDVSYVPARRGGVLTALANVPRAARMACAQLGVSPDATTRPLRLNWTASVGKFRRGF